MAGLGMITGREEEVLVSYQTKSTALVLFKVHWILAVSQSREAVLGKSSVTQRPIGCELSSMKGFGGDQLVLIKGEDLAQLHLDLLIRRYTMLLDLCRTYK